MKKKRRIFFYSLVFLFLVLSPGVVFYSFGYRFDFDRKIFEQTGGIFVKSKIPRLAIFLDGSFIKTTSFLTGGALLPEISAGTYLLRIEKTGFRPWSKRATVGSALVTEFRDVLLIPNPVFHATSTTDEVGLIKSALPNPASNPYKIDKKNNLVKKTSTSTQIIAHNVYSFGAVDRGVLYVDRNGFLAERSENENETLTRGRPGFFLKEGAPMKFIQSNRGDVAILDASEGLFILDGETGLSAVSGGVKNVYFDGAGNKLLVLRDKEIDAIWMRANSSQPFQKKGAVETIFAGDDEIQDAVWFFEDNSHLIFKTKEGVFIIELDGRGGRNLQELVAGKVSEITTSTDMPNKLFFRKDKVWKKIAL